MKNKQATRLLFVLCMVLALLGGCGRSAKADGAKCTVFLETMPQEFAMLPESVRQEFEISVTLRSVTSDKKHQVKLTEANAFQQELNLSPGPYEVYWCYAGSPDVVQLSVYPATQSITLDRKTPGVLPVLIKDATAFSQTMLANVPTEGILNAEPYSRQVQYRGQLLSLEALQASLTFVPTDSNQRLKPAEVAYVPATTDKGVAMVVQNQTKGNLSLQECTFVGMRFSVGNVVMPKGVAIGMDIGEVSHAKTGRMGKPEYFTGTPLMGIGYDKSTAVYLDTESGDRISFTVDASHSFVTAITYEFAKYE